MLCHIALACFSARRRSRDNPDKTSDILSLVLSGPSSLAAEMDLLMVVDDDTQIVAVSTFDCASLLQLSQGEQGSSERGTKTRLTAAPILHSQSL